LAQSVFCCLKSLGFYGVEGWLADQIFWQRGG